MNRPTNEDKNKTKKTPLTVVRKFRYSWGTFPGQVVKKKVAEFHCREYRSDGVTGYCNYDIIHACSTTECPGRQCKDFQGEDKICLKQIRTKNCPAPGSHERCIVKES